MTRFKRREARDRERASGTAPLCSTTMALPADAKPTRSRMTVNAVLRYPEQRRALEGSPSLPALRPSRFPPSHGASPMAVMSPGAHYVNRIVDNILAFTEEEMRARGLPRRGSNSEARIAVWREALALFAQQMPSSEKFLSKVMIEFDHAISGLVDEVQRCEGKLTAAWLAQQQAEARAASATGEAEKVVKAMLAQKDEYDLAAILTDVMSEHQRARLAVLCLESLSEPMRKDALASPSLRESVDPQSSVALMLLQAQQAAEAARVEVLLLKREVRELSSSW